MEDKSILIYDIISKPEVADHLTLTEFFEYSAALKVVLWDSSLGGKAPYVIKGTIDPDCIEKYKILDLKNAE